jgi:hypothetical protein
MKTPDWTDPPEGVTRCLQWLQENLTATWEHDSEKFWLQAERVCPSLLSDLREELQELYQELVTMDRPSPQFAEVERHFLVSNDCYVKAIEGIERWLADPTQEGLDKVRALVERGAALLQQADAMSYTLLMENQMTFDG